MGKFVGAFAAMLVVFGCSSKDKLRDGPASHVSHPLPTTLEEAVNSEFRSPEMRARDQYRHPIETLRFFGIEPQMTVVEISPGGGWYTQILAPFLAARGQYIAASVPSDIGEYFKEQNAKQKVWLSAHPELSSTFKVTDFYPPSRLEIAPAGSADMVLTFRNIHNWMDKGGVQEAFNAFYKALKPGGILGVVEHRANPNQKFDPKARSGYVREQDVIRMAKTAGFQLVAKSEINANPKDTKNYPEGVWTLPPVLRLKDQDREKYLAIGESDRMTLKFIKR